MSNATRSIAGRQSGQVRWGLAVTLVGAILLLIVGTQTGLFGTTTQAQVREVTFSKSFTPSTIGPGSVTTLAFNISNTDPTPLTNLAFTDPLPSGVFIASPANATTTCGGVLVAPDGGTSISFSADRLGAGSACVITVDVTSSILETHTNVSGDLTSDSGNHGNASADLTVDGTIPGFSKSFSPDTIPPGGTSTLVFTIDNAANQGIEEYMNFTDLLPLGMVIATPANASTDCSSGSFPASLTAEPGTNLVSLFYGYVGESSICHVSVDVTVNDFGTYVNSSGELAGGSYPNTWTGGKATAVMEAPRRFLVKSFTDDPVAPGSTTTLEFTVTNLDRSNTASDIAFTDDLDTTLAGLEALGLPLADPCGTGSQLNGTSTLTLSGGQLAPEASCTFSVTLQVPAAASAGVYTNTTGAVTAQLGGDVAVYDPAVDQLFVSPAPVLTKSFDDPAAAGGTVTLAFTITNASLISSVTDISFVDVFFPFLPTAASVPPADFCGAGSVATFVPLGDDPPQLNVTGANLAPGASCTFDLVLNIATDAPGGTYANTTSVVAATIDGTPVEGRPATDALTLAAAPQLRKSFDDPALPGDTVALEFTLSHGQSSPGDATDIAFTDNVGAVLPGLVATNLPLGDVCGAGSLINGTTDLSFTGGSLAPGETCTFSVTLQIPVDATSGVFANQTSNVTADVLGLATTGTPAQDELTVAGLSLTKSFEDDPVIPGDTVILAFTLVNTSTVHAATSISFLDDLAGVLSGLAATDLPKNDVCGTGSSLSLLGSLLYFQDGSLDPQTACTFTTTLQVPAGAASGTYNNLTQGFSATIDGATATLENASDALTVSSDWLLFSKSFIDDPTVPGDPVTLAFTVTNLHETQSVADVAFTDDLNTVLPGLSAVGLPVDDVCGAGSQIAGTSTLALTGGSLGPEASCTFSVELLVPPEAALGTYNNTTAEIAGTISGLDVRGDPALDDLLVSALAFSKSFNGPTIPGGNPLLTFMIHNPSTSTLAADISFSDDLDAMMPGLVATDLPESGFCGLTAQLDGSSLLNMRGGSLEPEASCTFSVTLQVPLTASVGSFVNTTSDLLLSSVKASDPATATLTVEPPPSFRKGFAPDAILLQGTSTLSFTIDNTASALAADGLDFTDDLPAGMVVADPPNATITCIGGTLTADAGTGIVVYSGGTVEAGTRCVVQVDVVGVAEGTHVNTTGDLTSSSGNSGPTSDTLIVGPVADLAVLKSASPDPVEAGQTLTYTLTVSNNGPSEAANVYVLDTLPDEFTISGSTCGMTGTPLTWNVGTLALEDSATCIVTGTVDAGFSGILTNTATVDSSVFDPQPTNNTVTQTTMVYEPAAIGDYVWYDANQDGIQDGDEDGMPDITVNLRNGANTTQLDTTTTDANGFYSFTRLMPGDYVVEFVLPLDFVFTLQDQGTDDAVDSDADPVTGQTRAITLASGESDWRWDAGLYEREEWAVYLPLVTRGYTVPLIAPDLVVENVVATPDGIQVTIKNQGNAPVGEAKEFWLEAYIAPDPAPTAVDQLWYDLCDEGIFWAITSDLLPLEPGQSLTVTSGDAHYMPDYSRVNWPLDAGTPVYVQVDAYGIGATYGLVYEDHEILGGAYNNIAGPFYVTTTLTIRVPSAPSSIPDWSNLSALPDPGH